MEIQLTNKQYRVLLDLVYLGNWMINAIRDRPIAKYDEIEQYIFSFAKESGLEHFIEYDEETKHFFPTNEYEMKSEIEEYRQEYNENNFWEELISRLAERDLENSYGPEGIKKFSREEMLTKLMKLEDKYSKEFENYGLERLEIKLDDQSKN